MEDEFTMSALSLKIIEEITSAPEAVRREVLDFLVSLQTKEAAGGDSRENLLALAQTAWGPDWDTPEEDAAWRDL
jgi:hypothetical protein